MGSQSAVPSRPGELPGGTVVTQTLRRAKIVCTLGPASGSPGVIEQLIGAGMDVARLNFSHGSHEDHARNIVTVRQAAEKLGRAVAILQDLQGPKIRLGSLASGPFEVKKGERLVITTKPVAGGPGLVSTTYAQLPGDVREGGTILVDDGLIELRVEAVSDTDVECSVVDGGTLKPKKGLNLPGARISAPSLTEKDREDLIFGLSQGVDYVALSFVRRPEDVQDVRDVMAARGMQAPVIAKLEKPEALDRLEEILAVVDGVMIARGDMGVEMPPEQVPVAQKRILTAACAARVLVITATQMLESMTENPRPTRAEASDVANAIFDGTDATMLSGETASGKFPIEAVEMMARIATTAEANPRLYVPMHTGSGPGQAGFAEATCLAACDAARAIQARWIVAFTRSGNTARLLSKMKPRQPILAFTPDAAVRRRLALCWGVTPLVMPTMVTTDALIEELDQLLIASGYAAKGDPIVIIMGSPVSRFGTTNLLKLHRVGEF